ncbi:MAG: GmrSD restriction endonuclease domain-containing protein [Chlorobium sp.]
MRSIYPDDEAFSNAFGDKQLKTNQLRNKRIVRYILFKLETPLSGTEYDFDSGRYNIEHILPESS